MLYNEDYRNVNLNEKADLILIDIPYNIGKNAYASSNRWWKDNEFKNGKSEKANTSFFSTDEEFNIEDMLSYIQKT